MLLVDDVQFLEGKPHTEEEFFHTFNALYEAGSQLVLSADRLPERSRRSRERLRDRFEWGLRVESARPTCATRLDVLRRPRPRGRDEPPTATRCASSPAGSTPTSASSTAP